MRTSAILALLTVLSGCAGGDITILYQTVAGEGCEASRGLQGDGSADVAASGANGAMASAARAGCAPVAPSE